MDCWCHSVYKIVYHIGLLSNAKKIRIQNLRRHIATHPCLSVVLNRPFTLVQFLSDEFAKPESGGVINAYVRSKSSGFVICLHSRKLQAYSSQRQKPLNHLPLN